MNVDSEQITVDKNLIIAQDQPLKQKEIYACLINTLGKEHCKLLSLEHGKCVLELMQNGKCIHILARSCTYLGNPHPIFKKRVQFPLWFNEYCKMTKEKNPNIDVRYMGVYHFEHKDYGNNIIFIDFDKDTYLNKKGHNSSAHVYINDLYQSLIYGIFQKEDAFGNIITTIRQDKLPSFFENRKEYFGNELFDLFRKFNCGFSFGQWLKALDVIKEMYSNNWRQWKQAEWAGWFLEYRFNKFTIENNITNKIKYVGCSLKKEGDFDFDLRFEDNDFYGDLKASDINKKETPGNDQQNLIECIMRYDKFWYVIYEHETIKDSEDLGYKTTQERNLFIKSVDPSYDKDIMSYHQRMKSQVCFKKMSIIELNRMNYREALTDFNQGRQASGEARKPKFNINKRVLSNDNFVVFRYSYNK